MFHEWRSNGVRFSARVCVCGGWVGYVRLAVRRNQEHAPRLVCTVLHLVGLLQGSAPGSAIASKGPGRQGQGPAEGQGQAEARRISTACGRGTAKRTCTGAHGCGCGANDRQNNNGA